MALSADLMIVMRDGCLKLSKRMLTNSDLRHVAVVDAAVADIGLIAGECGGD